MTNKGKLFLIPNVIAENTEERVVGPGIRDSLKGIHHFLAEDIRTARRYFSKLKIYDSIESLRFSVLDKDTTPESMKELFTPVFDGFDLGVISESGCPGVADPGALAVKFAHKNDIRVVPLVGPSSLLLALMGSGLNGQKFAFHGYLPIESKEVSKTIQELERESRQKNQTQMFIETPYRNNTLFQNLIRHLSPATLLCVAFDLTGESEQILTKEVRAWRTQSVEWVKKPAVFLFLA